MHQTGAPLVPALKDVEDNYYFLTTDENGKAPLRIRVTGEGPITVLIRSYDDLWPVFDAQFVAINHRTPSSTCYTADVKAAPAQANAGDTVRVDIEVDTYSCFKKADGNGTAPAPRHVNGNGTAPADRGTPGKFTEEVSLNVGIVGPATFKGQVWRKSTGRSSTPTRRQGPTGTRDTSSNLYTLHTFFGEASFEVEVTGPGPITFIITDYDNGIIQQLDYATVNTETSSVGTPVAKLQLLFPPFRNIYSPATVTAVATDDSNAPVAGATISFSAYGSNAVLSQGSAVTDSTGRASVTVGAHRPGVVSVVAGATNAAGVAVVEAAQINFFTHHHDQDHYDSPQYGYEHYDRDGRY